MPNTEFDTSDIDTAAAPGSDTSFESDFDAFLKEAEGSWTGDDEYAGAEDEADPVISAQDERAPSEDEAAAPALPKPSSSPEKEEDPAVQRGLDRLVAREVELQRKDADIRARESQVAVMEREIAQLKTKNYGVDDFAQLVSLDPGEALQRLGVNPDHVINLYLAKKMGDKAPPELRQALQKAEDDKRFRELENKLAARDHQVQYADSQRQTAEEVRAYVSGDLNGIAPNVAARLKSKPAALEKALLEEIRLDAVERLTRGEARDARVISAQEALIRLEKRLVDFLDDPSTTPAVVPANTTDSKVTQGTNARQGEAAKPPVKNRRPLRPWQAQDQADIEDAGIRAAVGEYRRSESARRR